VSEGAAYALEAELLKGDKEFKAKVARCERKLHIPDDLPVILEPIRQKDLASKEGCGRLAMGTKSYRPAGYDTDLSDAEWELWKPLIYPADAKRGRGRWRDPSSARACLDAIRYVLKTGCQWSFMPKDFAPKSIVHGALST
jgi:hypothetical protein